MPCCFSDLLGCLKMKKIDFHIHTIATKDDEKTSRNCPSADFFVEKLKDANVGICAITNHNYFDSNQYTTYSKLALEDGICVLPGVEMDVVLLDDNIGHCILIANPDDFETFVGFCADLGLNKQENANSFKIKIADFVSKIKYFDCLLLVHYKGKSKSFSEADIDYLNKNVSNKVVMVEPSNLISAFVYLAQGKNSLVGSDCQDWNNYPGKELPELKIDISSFGNLMLALRRDESFIKSILDLKKNRAPIHIKDSTYPDLELDLPLYNDVNIIFGGKSTGKTIIINDIASYFTNNGFSNKIAKYIASDKISNFKREIEFTPTEVEINDYCPPSLDAVLKRFKESVLPTIDSVIPQLESFLKNKTGELAKKIGFYSCSKQFFFDEVQTKREIQSLVSDYNKISTFEFNKYKKHLSDEEYKEFLKLIEKIKCNIVLEQKRVFVAHYKEWLANKAIKDIKTCFSNTKGQLTKPNNIGLLDLYNSIVSLARDSDEIKRFLRKESVDRRIKIGELDKKGELFRREEMTSNPLVINSSYTFLKDKLGINDLKRLDKNLSYITIGNGFNYISFKNALGQVTSFLKDKVISKPSDFMAYKSSLVNIDNQIVNPSSGEQSVILLGQQLFSDKDIYIFDEPELSVGHDYVNRVIVPRLKELSKNGKMVIVSTHDANIAVRTLPYLTVYREEEKTGDYTTYIGNLFNGFLTDTKTGKSIVWKEQTLKTLEGGAQAFEERETAYGK